MSRRMLVSALLLTGLGVLSASALAQGGRSVGFDRDVLPLMQNRCFRCHSARAAGGLKVDTLANLMRGGNKGPIVVPGRPQESRLLGYLTGAIQPRMPQGGAPLSQIEIATIRDWIQQGAKAQAEGGAAAGTAGGAARPPRSGQPVGDLQPLEILQPKDGEVVREKVTIKVPRAGVPADGFIGIYVDKKFRGAVAPMSEDELRDKKLPLDNPLTFVWDSQIEQDKSPIARDSERFALDGPHVLEIRSYNSDAKAIGATRINVILRNAVETRPNQPVRLWYGGIPNQQYHLEHTVDVDASASTGSFGGAVPTTTTGAGDRFTHKEVGRYLVSLEDLEPGSLTGFWRERRESPMALTVNAVKNLIQLDSSSRYYSLFRNGRSVRATAMTREKRFPILNPIDLPGRPHRINEPFNSNIRVVLGAYIPGALELNRVQAKVDGLEYQHRERCARIKLTYLSGTSKVDINSVGIQAADFEISTGQSTIWFSESTQRVVKAVHDITGTLIVDNSAAEFGGGLGAGGFGGEMGPGMMGGGPGMMAGGPGAAGSGFGAPFGGAGAAGLNSGGGPGMMAGGPGMMAGGPGMMAGGPGMMGSGMEGGFGFGQQASESERAGLAQRKRRFHVKLKVTTEISAPKPEKKR